MQASPTMVAAAVVIVAAACAGGTEPAAGPGTPSPGRATPSPTVSPVPETFVASSTPEGVAVYETETTEVAAEVPIGPGGHGGAPQITVTADRGTVYASTEVTSCSAELFRASPGDDRPEQVRNGWFPAVSPDGSRLAYSRLICPGEEAPDIVVRDTGTREEERWRLTPPSDAQTTVMPSSWDPDGERLAFEVRVVPSGGHVRDATREVRILDPDEHDSLDETPVLAPEDEGAEWASPTFRGDRRTLVVGETGPDGSRVLEVDPRTGAVLGRLLEIDRRPTQLDLDRSGAHLLYVASHVHDVEDPEPDVLFRWNAAEGPQPLLERPFAARW